MAGPKKQPAPAAPQASFYEPPAGAAPADGAAGTELPVVAESPSGLTSMAPVDVKDGHKGVSADAAFALQDKAIPEQGTLAADIARIRASRKPFGAFTQKLAYAQRPGYHRHWFSDEPGRVDEAVSSGWAHVKDKQGQPVNRVVGRGRDGNALKGYLMELPSVFWEEDMQSRHDAAKARVDEIKKAPFRAKPGQAMASDSDKFYSPKDEVLTVRGPAR